VQSYTLTLSDTNIHNLKDLIQAANQAKSGVEKLGNVNDLICEYRSITFSNISANTLYIGDSTVSSSNCMLALTSSSVPFRLENPLGGQRLFSSTIYLKASGTLTLSFECIV
jgi:hypothetical protein